MPALATTGRSAATIDNSHLQRGMNARPTNVETSIPRTAQRDPNNFPYEYHEYPKQMTMVCTKEYLEGWMERHKQTDDNGKAYWSGGRPKVDVTIVPIIDEMGFPIQVHDEDEEAAFRAEHPEAIVVVSVMDENEKLRAENDRLKALIEENSKLRREASKVEPEADAELTDPSKQKGNALGGVVKDEKPKNPSAKGKPDNGLPPRLK